MSQSESVKYAGGVHVMGAPLSRPPGTCLFAHNYEIPLSGGYRRVDGYTLYDGHANPAAVTGSGAVRGVWLFKNELYAFRDANPATFCVMYKATGAGWAVVALGHQVTFTSGTTGLVVGATVTGATSTKAGVVTYIAIQSGTLGAGNAVGTIHFTTLSGTLANGENLQIGGVTKAVASAASTANTLPAGGFYEFVNTNFYGTTSTESMYGVNGVGKAFAFDGTNFAFISTGMTTDTPNHIAAFQKHLVLSFPGGSVQHSGLGEPLVWSAITGASEIAVGDDVVGFSVEVGDILVIASRNRIHLLRGTGFSNWTLQAYSEEAGALEKTIQRIGRTAYLDDRGLTTLAAAQDYGDFASNAFSANFAPIVEAYKTAGVKCSCIVREKGQYRIFFAGGRGLYCTFDNKFLGATTVLFPNTVECICSGEVSGAELVFFGGSDGKVYKMDNGTSFNGTAILSLLRPQYWHYRSPSRRKRFRRMMIEADADASVTFSVAPDFSYSDNDTPTASAESYTMTGGAGYWEIDNWDAFNWSVPVSPATPCYIEGIGTNMSPLFSHSSATAESFTLYGHVVEFDYRGGVR